MSVDVMLSKPCTRSALSSPTDKRPCFVCNKEEEESTFRISKISLGEKTKNCKTVHLNNPNSAYHLAAKRLDLMLKGPALDIYAADIF